LVYEYVASLAWKDATIQAAYMDTNKYMSYSGAYNK